MTTRNYTTQLAVALSCLTFVASAHALPVVVPGQVNFNTIVTGDQTASSWSRQETITDIGSGESATIEITLSSATGEFFNKLDGNTRLSIGTTFDDENHVNVGENPTFIVSLVNKSSGVGSVGFNITDLGLRDTGNPSVSWTSSVSTIPVVLTSFTGEADRAMDDSSNFHLISSSDYSGTLAVTADQFQFTENGARNGIQFSVQLSPAVPEPSTVVLGFLALCGLGACTWRRRRSAA